MNVPNLHKWIRQRNPRSLPPYNHKKPQIYPHKQIDIYYGTTIYYYTEADSGLPIYAFGIKRFQGIVDALLYYDWDIYNKLLVALSVIGS